MKIYKQEKIYIRIAIAVLLWVAITSIIYEFKHPDKTKTESFLHIPKSAILDFK